MNTVTDQSASEQAGIGRRQRFGLRFWIALAVIAVAAALVDAFQVEPHRLRVRHVAVPGALGIRIVQFSDVHFIGDIDYLVRVIDVVNAADADIAVFTGDLMQAVVKDMDKVLSELKRVNKPLFGVPGNHDRYGPGHTEKARQGFQATGGDWLVDTNVVIRIKGRDVEIVGWSEIPEKAPEPSSSGLPRLLLCHYPDVADRTAGQHFDLILAGHTHGGQVNVPVVGRMAFPDRGHKYVRGLYETPAGPMYVTPGIGTYHVNARFLCRPEVSLIGIGSSSP